MRIKLLHAETIIVAKSIYAYAHWKFERWVCRLRTMWKCGQGKFVVSSSERCNFQFTRVNVRGQRQWPNLASSACTIAYGALDVIIIIIIIITIIIIINIMITTKSNRLGLWTRQAIDSSTSTRWSNRPNAKVFRYILDIVVGRFRQSRYNSILLPILALWGHSTSEAAIRNSHRKLPRPIWGYRLRPRTRHSLNDSQVWLSLTDNYSQTQTR